MLELTEGATPASFIRPPGEAVVPGWIVLHGVTVPGRHHPGLKRFAHALASTGGAVIIPEVPAWRNLHLDPEPGNLTIAAAVEYLAARDDVRGSTFNIVGFSFGATQALINAARPELRGSLRAVVAFGGYADLGRTLRCMVTGEYEWRGKWSRFEPDPYGRWIVVGNYLTDIQEYSQMESVQVAARKLAMEAGRRGAYAAEKEYDSYKSILRQRMSPDEREIWDLIAPPAGVTPPLEPGRRLAEQLLEAAVRKQPGLDPGPYLPKLDQRIVLAHGAEDRLIPYTEALRLREMLPSSARVSLTITRLFAHSRGAGRLGFLTYPLEVARYLALLGNALQPA